MGAGHSADGKVDMHYFTLKCGATGRLSRRPIASGTFMAPVSTATPGMGRAVTSSSSRIRTVHEPKKGNKHRAKPEPEPVFQQPFHKDSPLIADIRPQPSQIRDPELAAAVKLSRVAITHPGIGQHACSGCGAQ